MKINTITTQVSQSLLRTMIQRLQPFCSVKTLIHNHTNQEKKPHWNAVPLFISSPVQISFYGLIALSPAFQWTLVFRGRDIKRSG